MAGLLRHTMLYPISMFCCGCSIQVGVNIIMACHLAACCLYVFSVSSNVIFHVPLLASAWTVQSQLFYAGFCLLGIPVIAGAIAGVLNHIEVNVRLYLYYLMACFLLNAGTMVYMCLVQDACESIGTFVDLMSSNFGEAFLCGIFRIVSYFAAAAGISTEVYCLWVVWSLCESMRDGKGCPELATLMPMKDSIVMKAKRIQEEAHAGFIGFSKAGLPGAHASPYGSVSADGDGSLFGGFNHETEYLSRP